MGGELNRPDPGAWRGFVWRTVFAAALPALVLAVQGCQLDADTYFYVEYWHKLLRGIPHGFTPHEVVPKAVPIVFFGILYDLSGSFEVLALASILVGAMGAAALSQVVEHFFNRPGAHIGLFLLVVNPVFHQQCMDGSSAIMQLALLAWAARLALHVGPMCCWGAGACALLAGLCRPDVWGLFGIGLLACLLRPTTWRMGLPVFGMAILSIPSWLGFNWLLTGDPLFVFRVMVNEDIGPANGTLQPVVHESQALWYLVASYAARLGSKLTSILPGPVFLLGACATVMLVKRSGWAGLMVFATLASVLAFYFQPFSNGYPMLSRFFVIPVAIHSLLAGPALLLLAEGLRAAMGPRITLGDRGLRALSSTALLSFAASLQSLHGVQDWYRSTGAQFASSTREMRQALSWIQRTDPYADERTVLTSPRRKGLAVVQLSTDSDRVESLLTIAPNGGRELDSKCDYILHDERDSLPEARQGWEFLDAAPRGFEELILEPPLQYLRVYRRLRLRDFGPEDASK